MGESCALLNCRFRLEMVKEVVRTCGEWTGRSQRLPSSAMHGSRGLLPGYLAELFCCVGLAKACALISQGALRSNSNGYFS